MSRLSSVLVSHFLLDLQEAHQRPIVGLGTNDNLQNSQSASDRSVRFANTFGSLGATIGPINYGRDEDDEDALVDDYAAAPEDIRSIHEGSASPELRIKDEFAVAKPSSGVDGVAAIVV